MVASVVWPRRRRGRRCDGDNPHFCGSDAVGIGGVERERLQPVEDHRDHAVAGLFEQALIDTGHHGGRAARLGLVAAIAGNHDEVARALEPSRW